MNRHLLPALIAGSMALSCRSGNDAPSSTVSPPLVEAGIPEPFTLDVLTDARIGSNGDAPDFHRVAGPVALDGGPFAEAKLVVDLRSTCFPFEQWKDDPPPAGHNWPRSCDAFDRNFEIALADPAAPASPAIELIRAITPFGGPLHLEKDVTDVLNASRGPRELVFTIPSYSDPEGKVSGSNGGWNVSARIEVTPGPAPRDVRAVVPLVYDDETPGGAPRSFPFTLPSGTTHARVEYLATGHGGGALDAACIGPADEFCRRSHTLTVDGVAIVDKKTLWRTDCKKLCTLTKGGPFGEYCLENPCGAPPSVRASRANWCPGSETAPIILEPEQLTTAGEHTIDLTIDKVAEGGNWKVSIKVFAYGD